uniref:Uncharacterized protein n=1 Tax=viral metagenome TaxID=1070528 RepID=A0A6H1ZSL2_9ZZZZ
MKKKKEATNYYMGKQTGYELIEGVYHIAPLYQEQFRRMSLEKSGIDEMLRMVTSHAAKDLERLNKVNEQIWADLAEDIGLNNDMKWQYFPNGTVKEIVEVENENRG